MEIEIGSDKEVTERMSAGQFRKDYGYGQAVRILRTIRRLRSTCWQITERMRASARVSQSETHCVISARNILN